MEVASFSKYWAGCLWNTQSYNSEDCNLLYEHVHACSYISTKAEFHIPIAICSTKISRSWLITHGGYMKEVIYKWKQTQEMDYFHDFRGCKMFKWPVGLQCKKLFMKTVKLWVNHSLISNANNSVIAKDQTDVYITFLAENECWIIDIKSWNILCISNFITCTVYLLIRHSRFICLLLGIL